MASYSPACSPEGKHLAYFAQKGLDWAAVRDATEGKFFSEVLTRSEPGLVFDSNQSFH